MEGAGLQTQGDKTGFSGIISLPTIILDSEGYITESQIQFVSVG